MSDQPYPTNDETPMMPFPVVGIGASAGGLEALQDVFSSLTTGSNMAFFVVQHLSPDFKSMMVQILQRHTQPRGAARRRRPDRRARPCLPPASQEGRSDQRTPHRAQQSSVRQWVAPAHRPLSGEPCRRSRQVGGGGHLVGHRHRRLSGHRPDPQGRWTGDGPGSDDRQVRWHAAERDRDRLGRLRAESVRARRAAGHAPGLGSCVLAFDRDRTASHHLSAREPGHPARPHLLQRRHPVSPHPATDVAARHGQPGRLRPEPPDKTIRSSRRCASTC